jgi:hypothetical protein
LRSRASWRKRARPCPREALCEELREETPIGDVPLDWGNKVDYDEDSADLPDDSEAEEAAAEQRALMASFEMKRHDESARKFMVAKSRAAARMAMAREDAPQSAHRRNMVVAKRRQEEEDQERATAAMPRASQRRDQYPLPSYVDYEDAERRCRHVLEDRPHRRKEANNRHFNSGAGPSSNGGGTSGAQY